MPKNPSQIVQAAYTYLASITPSSQKISDVRIEELKPFTEAEKNFWKVVLSFDNIGDNPFDRKRVYKEFRVSDEGEVIYMQDATKQ